MSMLRIPVLCAALALLALTACNPPSNRAAATSAPTITTTGAGQGTSPTHVAAAQTAEAIATVGTTPQVQTELTPTATPGG